MILLKNGREERGLICPHCERPMLGNHDMSGECTKPKISRRFFLGGLGLAAAGTAAGLAFTKKAEAALADFAIEEPVITAGILTETTPIAAIPAEIVKAAPRVHRGGAIVLTYEGNKPMMQIDRPQLQNIADREGRTVIFRENGMVHIANPSEESFKQKWENPIAKETATRIWGLGCDFPDNG